MNVAGPNESMSLLANQGTLHLRDVVLTKQAVTNAPMTAAIRAISCASLWCTDVTVDSGGPVNGTTSQTQVAPGGTDNSIAALFLLDSNLWAEGCRFVGYDNQGAGVRYGGDGVRMWDNATVRVVGSTFCVGGNANSYGGNGIHQIGPNLIGDASSYNAFPGSVQAGSGGVAAGGQWAQHWDRGFVAVGVTRQLASALPNSVGSVFTTARMSINTTNFVFVNSLVPHGNFFLFFGSPSVASTPTPGIENYALLDLNTMFQFAMGTLTTGTGLAGFTVPNAPALVGSQIAFQALMDAPIGNTVPALSWTTGAHTVIVP